MKINAIKSNIGFKGLFTDKRLQNNGDWLMEYRPYSWENGNTSKMANQTDIDIMASSLPDNDKIYKHYNGYGYGNGKKSATDIFGTEFYYEYNRGEMRNTITEKPAMNREESLKVYNSKLEKFIEMKKDKMSELIKEVANTPDEIADITTEYNQYSADVKKSIFSKNYDRDVAHNVMDNQFTNMSNLAEKNHGNFKKFVNLLNSINEVKNLIKNNEKEIKLLESTRLAGELVDISRRDIYDPNKLLWEKLKNLVANNVKFVALPNMTISIESLLKKANANGSTKDMQQKVIAVVDSLIRTKL